MNEIIVIIRRSKKTQKFIINKIKDDHMKKIYLNSENKATLVCPQCDKANVIDATRYLKNDGPIKIKFTFKCRHCYCGTEHAVDCDGTDCKQGHTLVALLERRRHYRKSVNLTGTIRDERGKEALMMVLDISKNGLCCLNSIIHGPSRWERL
jgi:hypothetical protein